MADALARRAGCPRPLTPILADSVAGLSPAQRCGVVWAALGTLPDGPAARALREGDTSAVLVLGISDAVTVHGPRPTSSLVSFDPPEPWFERERMGSHWIVSVASLDSEPLVALIWVDQRSGIARRVIRPGRGTIQSRRGATRALDAQRSQDRDDLRFVCLVTGLVLLVVGMRDRRAAGATSDWRPVVGTLLIQGPMHPDSTESLREAARRARQGGGVYHYRVGREDFVGLATSYQGAGHPPSTRLPHPPADAGVGVPVTVYVDPADPARAVLERTTAGTAGIKSIFYGVLCLATAMLLTF
ncbi:MAG TPA: DUF3592 domain-containing protein [Gemmatimonadaceae bacterium]